MPEGHTVHRTANQFRSNFLNRSLAVDSPQGRFSASAKQINGLPLTESYAIGKQLFLVFDDREVLRIHLGIYGKWKWHKEPAGSGFLAELPVGEVRARFYDERWLAELRGPTVCEVISRDEARAVHDRLGPDPLNPDPHQAERDRFITRVHRSGQSIGQLLMDQSVISGVGNVYRAELLYRAGVDPYLPGKQLPPEILEQLWRDAVRLLEVGVKTGVMITRDDFLSADPGKAERNFVYKREGEPCRECGTDVKMALLSGRKLYWCPYCQR